MFRNTSVANWGWQFAQTGWSKMHDIARITAFFASLNIPFPSVNAHFVAGLELFRGISLTPGTWFALNRVAAFRKYARCILDRRS